MWQEGENTDIKITTTNNEIVHGQTKGEDFNGAPALVPNPSWYSKNEVDLDTSDFFEERSNPLSSKGN